MGFEYEDIIDVALIQAFYLTELFKIDEEEEEEMSEYTRKAKEQLKGKKKDEPATMLSLINNLVSSENLSYTFEDCMNMTPNMFMAVWSEVGRYFDRIMEGRKGTQSNSQVDMKPPEDYEL